MANGEGGATTRWGRFTETIGQDATYHTDTAFAPLERTTDWIKHRIVAPFVKWAAIGAILFGVIDGGFKFINNGGIQSDDKSGVVARSIKGAMEDYWNLALKPFAILSGGLVVGTTKVVAKGAIEGVKAGIETAKESCEPPTERDMQDSPTDRGGEYTPIYRNSSPQNDTRSSQSSSYTKKAGNPPVNIALIEQRAMERMGFPANAVNRTARAPVRPVQAVARSNLNR